MSFLLRLAWRDTRASRRRLLLYSSTIVLGIAALVSVSSFGVNVRRTLTDQPRRLLGADLTVGLGDWPNAPLEQFLIARGARLAHQKRSSSPLTLPGQTGKAEAVPVVEVDDAFPWYGDFSATPAGAIAAVRRDPGAALIDPHLAETRGLQVGDSFSLGTEHYTVAGVVREMPGESAFMLSLTRRVIVPWRGKPGHGAYRLFAALPAGTDASALAAELKNRFPKDFPVVTTAEELGRHMDEAIVNGTRFFALVMFVALFLGGIGVASALHVYIQERLARIAVLRCLGATAAQASGVYLLQAAGLGLCGALAGGVLGIATQFALPWLVRDLVPVRLDVFLAWPALAGGMAAGFVICLIFALLPLLAVRRVPPLAALRSEAGESAARDPWRLAVWGGIVLAVLAFAFWQSRHWPVAIAYVLALIVAFSVFAGLAQAVAVLSRRLPLRSASFAVRHGFASLHRPRNRTQLLLLALGLGLFLVLTVYLLRSTLLQDFAGKNTPNLVVLQLPADQEDAVQALARREHITVMQRLPAIALSLESVNGRPFIAPASDSAAGRRLGRADDFSGKVQGSFRDHLMAYETLVSGKFVGQVKAGEAVVPVTVANWMTLRRPGAPPLLRVGDEAVWKVEGVPVRTRVTGVRRQEGLHLDPMFAVVFPLGSVDAAPADWMLFTRSPDPAATARFSAAVAAAAPHARLIDVAGIIDTFERVFAKVALVVDFIAFFTIATGMIILAAAVAAGRHQRARESVLMRTLGASRAQLRVMQFTEYAALGALAAVVGCGLAAAATALVAHFLFRIPAGGNPVELATAAAAVVAVAVATGVLADRGTSRLSPLEILREET